MAKQGYVNGSDLLMSIGGKACGHSTSHTTTYTSETKDRAVKPTSDAAVDANAGMFKEKAVIGLSVQVKCEGLRFYGETENGMKELLSKWKTGATIELRGFTRGSDEAPYMSGSFIITSIEEAAPAGDDATYNATFDNSGAVTIDDTKVDANA